MGIENAFQGSLFTDGFLRESVTELEEWQTFDQEALDTFESSLRKIFSVFPVAQTPNESQTEDDLIWPVLYRLDWTASLRQQNLSFKGRDDIPDGLLFADDAAKGRAVDIAEGPALYAAGEVLIESKRWLRPLDRGSGRAGEGLAPSTQMLRYLRRADELTEGRLRWGILTNGAQWRLYYQGARSVSEQFFEIDLTVVLDLPGYNDGLFALSDKERRHCLKLFAIFFGRRAFLAEAEDGRTLHQRAIDEGRYFEERITGDLSQLVFERVFPNLIHAIAKAAPGAPLDETRAASLVFLYRLLFILYAEDRALLPVHDARYANIGLRKQVREDIRRRKEHNEPFSDVIHTYWHTITGLCRVIDQGEPDFGLPPYNGGLFDNQRTPLLTRIELGNRIMAELVDALSFEQSAQGRRYINYRDLSVQQLGSIYERLLEYEVIRARGEIVVRPNAFARKGSGSYYTPESLVGLILQETIGPLVDARHKAFQSKVCEVRQAGLVDEAAIATLQAVDPAGQLLKLKVCDPAMGSGHFLVSLVDYLADRVIAAMAEVDGAVDGYVSPVTGRIRMIRSTILGNAEKQGWTVAREQLDDRHVVRRMVLKRCVYGVDKNPMAVELAKVSLWLHTFTVGAPLSFLDHHLRAGDSLFGCRVRDVVDKVEKGPGHLFLNEPLQCAAAAADPMQAIEALTDAEIAEAERSVELFSVIRERTAPLSAFLSLMHALEWLNPHGEDKFVAASWLTGWFGDPIAIANGTEIIKDESAAARRFKTLLERARSLIAEERFLHWQVAFPGVWADLNPPGDEQGGFDAVIGNPPWDRIKLQQVEWFAARRPEIALAQRAADRKRMIKTLQDDRDPLAADFQRANDRATSTARMARTCGDYPLLSRGDINLYSLFVERAMGLIKPDGFVGLLTPSGICADKTAADFFKSISIGGRIAGLFDFENKKIFFKDVHASFKFCALIFSGEERRFNETKCAFFLHDTRTVNDHDCCLRLTPADFARINPNTGTAPVFRTLRDAEITCAVYERHPVLVDRSTGKENKAWPVKYNRMFDMANDSNLFRTREELEEREGAWPIGSNCFDSPGGEWVPLYEGKMVQAFDHRAASITNREGNLFRSGQPARTLDEDRRNPAFLPRPRYWVSQQDSAAIKEFDWFLAFKDVTASTNVRTMIASVVPQVGCGNTLPVLVPATANFDGTSAGCLLANLNSFGFDYIVRQKVQGTHLTWYIVEQLPIIAPDNYNYQFGPKTAAEIVREAVLELTYTSHDVASFARDLGYVDDSGNVKPPFPWDEDRRLRLRARLDAVFFHLYGVTDRDDVRYIYSTFPIVERQETEVYGCYRSRELCLAYMSALAAGRPDAEPEV